MPARTWSEWETPSKGKVWRNTDFKTFLRINRTQLGELEQAMEHELVAKRLLTVSFRLKENRNARQEAEAEVRRKQARLLSGSLWGPDKPATWEADLETCVSELAMRVNARHKQAVKRREKIEVQECMRPEQSIGRASAGPLTPRSLLPSPLLLATSAGNAGRGADTPLRCVGPQHALGNVMVWVFFDDERKPRTYFGIGDVLKADVDTTTRAAVPADIDYQEFMSIIWGKGYNPGSCSIFYEDNVYGRLEISASHELSAAVQRQLACFDETAEVKFYVETGDHLAQTNNPGTSALSHGPQTGQKRRIAEISDDKAEQRNSHFDDESSRGTNIAEEDLYGDSQPSRSQSPVSEDSEDEQYCEAV